MFHLTYIGRELRRRAGRTLLTALGLALGVGLVIGIIGGVIGGWIMRALGFQGQGGTLYTVLVAIGGAIVLTWLVRLITGNRGD